MSWRYNAIADPVVPDGAGVPVAGCHGGSTQWGEILYDLQQFWELDAPESLPNALACTAAATPRFFEEEFGQVGIHDTDLTVTSFLNSRAEGFFKVIVLPKAVIVGIFDTGWPAHLRTVSLGSRVNRDLFFAGEPSKAKVDRWREAAGAKRRRVAVVPPGSGATKGDIAMLELPKKRARKPEDDDEEVFVPSHTAKFDPLRLLNAAAFALHLRQSAEFKEAVKDARRYDNDQFSESSSHEDEKEDPGKVTLQRSAQRVDLVAMAIERRIWHREVEDDLVQSINCFSDSSPVVGAEIQGMLVDVMLYSGIKRRLTLPGGSVFYGLQDAISKTMVFVWAFVFALWAHVGPHAVFLRPRWVLDDGHGCGELGR